MVESKLEEIRLRLSKLKHPQSFLATVDNSGAPQVRPVTLMVYDDSFYLATSRSTRKARQIVDDNRVEFVTPFSEEGHGGYLRVMGLVQPISDLALMGKITDATSYPVTVYWRGVDDPDFFLFRVNPLRVEYMKPGDNDAAEVTDEFAG